ncbi:hypothetical protein CcCBS67573_g08147 [Chytriomyces confervae]|uniref:Wbp11/ELF5/Saf1 N-terminal domain-containing protein n=1 Tax=Chytriomyces confervae TaxID=246404 RepID=A0A507ENG0_9FUNG|nr:hypothetical protein HDU80_007834 [Chytriomyces hyalinus]TPX65352.1 hypothetical protein CcCBS67573_g08147 [Chytriomyces confervae]
MAKKGKELNPADALRKKERKKELKKNKDVKQKKEQLQASHKEALRLVEELNVLMRIEKESTLDKANRTKREKIEKRLEEINEARRAAGLPGVSLASVAKPKTQAKEDDYKWYHPTYNPHGPKRPPKGQTEAESRMDVGEDSSDADDTSEDEDDAIPILDYSNLPIPEGEAPMDAQFYHNLDLPEFRLEALPPNSKTPNPPLRKPETAPTSIQHQTNLMHAMPGPPFAFPFPSQMLAPPGFIPMPMHMPPHGYPPIPITAAMGFPPNMQSPSIPGLMPPTYTAPPVLHPPPRQPYNTMRPPPPPPPMHRRNQQNAAIVRDTSLPAKPNMPQNNEHAASTSSSNTAKPAVSAVAAPGPVTISVEPKMRDLQKELTQFVPRTAAKRGRGVGPSSVFGTGVGVIAAGGTKAVRSGTIGRVVVNSAPDVDDGTEAAGPTKPDDEFDAFMKEIGSR